MVKIIRNSDGTVMLFHDKSSVLDHEKFSWRYETGKDIHPSMPGAPNAVLNGDDPRITDLIRPGAMGKSSGRSGSASKVRVSARKAKDEYDISKMAVPPGVDLKKNIEEARRHRFALDPLWFYNQVKPGGPWDFKNKFKGAEGQKYVDYGNYHYGVVGRAAGVPEELLERLAGWNKVYEESNKRARDEPGLVNEARKQIDFWRGIPSALGFDLDASDDQPRDNWFIKRGIQHFEQEYKPPHDLRKIGGDPNVLLSVPGYY